MSLCITTVASVPVVFLNGLKIIKVYCPECSYINALDCIDVKQGFMEDGRCLFVCNCGQLSQIREAR